MVYYILKNKDIIPKSEVTVTEDGIAKYYLMIQGQPRPQQSEILTEMDDTATYIYEKKGLFGTKNIELRWIKKFDIGGSGLFKDKKGNDYSLSYLQVYKKDGD